MVQWLSKKIWIAVVAIFICESVFSQQNSTGDPSRSKDYKDPKQHERFQKRRNLVGAWQINKLKQGALVVRLKTNKMVIDELNKAGNNKAAQEKELEAFAINKNTMFAFRDKFNFCKVYFIYSNYSDSLSRGAKSGIFLDSNLKVDPAISMTENYYLLAERDYGYNSSIGFVPEDSARTTQETGNPVKQMAFVIKNKYGHQLKNPFPYFIAEKNYMNATYDLPITVNQGPNGTNDISFYVDRTYLRDMEVQGSSARGARSKGNATVKIQKQYTYEKLAQTVDSLNDNLRQYHQASPTPEEGKIPEDVKPFLY